MIELFVAALAGLSALSAEVARIFSATSHGPNPWTLEAFQNTLRLAYEMAKAVRVVNGSINVAYRSPAVNAKVGGAPDSYHMKGLAIDIHPGKGFTAESGSRALYAAAVAGKLGPVRTIIWEPTWCHVDWHDPDEVGPPPPTRFIKLVGPNKYERVQA